MSDAWAREGARSEPHLSGAAECCRWTRGTSSASIVKPWENATGTDFGVSPASYSPRPPPPPSFGRPPRPPCLTSNPIHGCKCWFRTSMAQQDTPPRPQRVPLPPAHIIRYPRHRASHLVAETTSRAGSCTASREPTQGINSRSPGPPLCPAATNRIQPGHRRGPACEPLSPFAANTPPQQGHPLGSRPPRRASRDLCRSSRRVLGVCYMQPLAMTKGGLGAPVICSSSSRHFCWCRCCWQTLEEPVSEARKGGGGCSGGVKRWASLLLPCGFA